MTSVGYQLKAARLEQGITLEQMSGFTKIPIYSIESIECDKFSDLPNETVARGFVRSICRVLGLDDARCLDELCTNASRQSREVKTLKQPLNGEVLKSSGSKTRFIIALIVFLIFGSLLLLVIFTPSTIRGSEKLSGSVDRVVNTQE
ncbi:MAG: helix-turn-helix domain-containing protein [Pseudomonadota bacterium]